MQWPGWEAWKRLGTIFGTAGGLSAAAYYFVAGLHAAPPPPYLRSIYALGATTLILALATVGLLAVLAVQGRRIQKHADHLTIMRELNQVLGIDYLYCTFLRVRGSEISRDQLNRQFDLYVEELLTHVAAIFEAYTGKRCAACIKVFSKSNMTQDQLDPETDGAPGDGAVVFTLGRDQHSRFERKSVDEPGSSLRLYNYKYNTAFLRITHDPAYEGYFFGNNLTHSKDYSNARPHWEKYYNAVAVASLKNPTHNAVDQAMGFLCVDNKGGEFDDVECRQILESLASILYYSIRSTLAVLKSNPPSEIAA